MAVNDAWTFPARLVVVADRDYIGDDARWLALIEAIGTAAAGMPVAIQVRAKGITPVEAADLATRARAVVPANVLLLLNGDAALAARLGYAGAHWPEHDIPAARPALALAYYSAAAHSAEAAARAERGGADVVLFGAVYAPGSHPGEGAGVEALRAAVQATALPVIALGGILPQHVAECMATGAFGVAAVSGVLGAPDVHAAIEAYLGAIDETINTSRTQGAVR